MFSDFRAINGKIIYGLGAIRNVGFKLYQYYKQDKETEFLNLL